ncbi:MAG: hypothetical protein L6R38_003552 [Xanthoria sp. 2 TBL-2021]|nr:MAG: hypothetical protein L6R38_003552 [Xanthoria sp. 2 TBL-2021]
MHRLYGLNVHPNTTVAFDVPGLIQLLSVPRQLRRANPYAMKFIKMVNRNNVHTALLPSFGTFRHHHDMDWTRVASANFGLEIQWKPTQRGTWLSNFLKNVLTFAIGLIPVVGPLLAIAFPLGWTAITDPDAFLDEMRNLMPGFDLTARMAEKIRESIKEQRKCLPNGWEALNFSSQGLVPTEETSSEDTSAAEPPPDLEEIGRSLAFIIAEDVLAHSALPRKDEPADDDDPDEIELVNQPTANPFETTACAKFSDTK